MSKKPLVQQPTAQKVPGQGKKKTPVITIAIIAGVFVGLAGVILMFTVIFAIANKP